MQKKLLFVRNDNQQWDTIAEEVIKIYPDMLYEVVSDKEQYIISLSKFNPDIIIAAFKFTDYNGLDLITIRNKYQDEIPLIIFTEPIDEETAALCIKSGASDYITSNNKLLTSIKQILDEEMHSTRNIDLTKIYPLHSTKDKLKESESRFRSFFEHTDKLAVQGYNINHEIIYWNKASEYLYGYTQEEVIGKKLEDTIIPSYMREGVFEAVENWYKHNIQIPSGELGLQRKDASIVNVYSSHLMFNNMYGEQEMYCVDIDISDLIDAENALRESEARFRHIFDNSSIGMYRTTADGNIILANKKLINLLGYNSLEELLERNLEKEGFESHNPRSNFKQLMQTDGEVVNLESIWVTKDNDLLYIRENATAIKDKDGNILFYEGTAEDITEVKVKENEIIEREEKFRRIAENSPDIITRISIKGVLLYISPSSEKILGYKAEEIIAANIYEFIHPDDIKPLQNFYKSLLLNQTVLVFIEHRIRKKTGEYIWVETTALPLTDHTGKVFEFQGTHRDITERKIAHDAIKLNEARLNSLYELNQRTFNNEQEIIRYALEENIKLTCSKVGFLCFVNNGFADPQLFVWSEEVINECQLTERNKLDVSHAGNWAESIRTKKTYIDNDYLNNPDKHSLPESHVRIIRYLSVPIIENNDVTMLVGVANKESFYEEAESKQLQLYMSDVWKIIKKKRDESELKKLSSAVNQSPASIIITDVNGNIQYVNPKFEHVTGYSSEEVIGKNPRILKSGKMPASKYLDFWNTILRGEEWRGEFQNRKKNGELYWESVSVSSIKNNNGDITHFIAVKEDITEKKNSQELVLKTVNQFTAIWENSFDAMCIVNEQGIIVRVNEMFCKLFGKKYSDIEGKHFLGIYHKTIFDKKIDQFNELFFSSKIKNYDEELTIWNGRKLWIEQHNTLIDLKDQPVLLFSIFRDITERKKAEKEILKSKEKAEETNKLKSNFLANMSHELRTPLIGILGFSEILSSEIKDPEILNKINIINLSGKRLLGTINQILDLSRIESSKTELKYETANIFELTNDVIKKYFLTAQMKGLLLSFDCVSRLFWKTDKKLYTLIIKNLVDNAVKYSNSGKVQVNIQNKIGEKGKSMIISVADTGIGISEENQKIVFEPFRQVSEGYGRSHGGSGLGLTLVKKFVEFMGGTISLTSKLGTGSTFTVTFSGDENIDKPGTDEPNTRVNETEKPKVLGKPLILMVEDELINQMVIKTYLKEMANIEATISGESAVEMATKKQYNLILMDINLAGRMNGIEASKHIRKIDGYDKTPIVAMTAYAMHGDREKFLKEGLDHYIPKPFTKNDMVSLISTLI